MRRPSPLAWNRMGSASTHRKGRAIPNVTSKMTWPGVRPAGRPRRARGRAARVRRLVRRVRWRGRRRRTSPSSDQARGDPREGGLVMHAHLLLGLLLAGDAPVPSAEVETELVGTWVL